MRAKVGALVFALTAALVIAPRAARADGCTLLQVDRPEAAKLRVYFTKFAKEDTTGGKYKRCRRVKQAEPGTLSFFVTPFRQDATDVVHDSNWPR